MGRSVQSFSTDLRHCSLGTKSREERQREPGISMQVILWRSEMYFYSSLRFLLVVHGDEFISPVCRDHRVLHFTRSGAPVFGISRARVSPSANARQVIGHEPATLPT